MDLAHNQSIVLPTDISAFYSLPPDPVIDQIIILSINDMDTLVDLYFSQNNRFRKIIDDPYTLNKLKEKFDLFNFSYLQMTNGIGPMITIPITTFGQLVTIWDQKHASRGCFRYNNPRKCALLAAEEGNITVLRSAIGKISNQDLRKIPIDRSQIWHIQPWKGSLLEVLLTIGAAYGHMNVIEEMIKWGANRYGNAMIEAVRGGHLAIYEFLKKNF